MAASLNQPQFRTPEHARLYLERLRWPDGPICPHCGSISKEHYPLAGKTTRPGLWKCKDCREPFTVTVGTVFERSKIALNIWLQAAHLMCASKKGISSHQLHRMLGVTYKTAWFMSHRIREAMTVKSHGGPIGGKGSIVEADETYWGTETGKSRKDEFGFTKRGGGVLPAMNKIVSLVERGGNVRSFHVADVTGQNLKSILVKQIHADTHVMTDASPRYNVLKRDQPFAAYDQVNHSQKEYVRGNAHTNTVEGYF